MRAVVLGGNGFIGSHIVDALRQNGWSTIVYDRHSTRFQQPLPDVEYIHGQLEDVSLLTTVLARSDVVFHTATTTIPQTSNEMPIFDIQTNLVDTIRLLEACVKTKVQKVIFISTGGAIYGIPDTLPVPETHPLYPICSYGIVKLAIEKYLHLFCHLYGLSYIVLRPSNPYGRRQNPTGSQGAIAVFLGRIAQGLPISLWGTGEVVRDYFHVSDLARASIQAATRQTTPSIFNIGSGQGTSLNQLLAIIENVVGKPIEIIRQPGRSFDVPELILDVQAAREALGWEATIPLVEGIADTWQWTQSLKWPNK